MKIGIELNYLIRDINSQMLKYYMKDIDKSFDDSNVEKNVTTFINSLGFKTKKSKETFLYVDYPYEIFGCAKTMNRNSSVMLNGWLEKMDNEGYNGSEVSLFSLKENALTIQSTYYFLSKIGCRVRNMFFPKDGIEMWDKCDVIITTNERIVKNKPEGKKVVLILTKDNSHLCPLCDFVYDTFTDVIEDNSFFRILEKTQPKQSLFGIIKTKIKKFLRINGR